MAKDYNIAKKSVQDEILEAVGSVAQQEDVQQILSKVANGVEPSFRSPTRMVVGDVTTELVSGTGKGKLFLCRSGLDVYLYTVQIDGVTILSEEKVDISSGSLELEFKQSFSVKSSNGSAKMNYVAIYY